MVENYEEHPASGDGCNGRNPDDRSVGFRDAKTLVGRWVLEEQPAAKRSRPARSWHGPTPLVSFRLVT